LIDIALKIAGVFQRALDGTRLPVDRLAGRLCRADRRPVAGLRRGTADRYRPPSRRFARHRDQDDRAPQARLLATARPYRGVFLTEKGEGLAERVRIRHRLVVDVLRALGVPTESAEADAEGIEHHVSETTLKAFAHFVKSQR
jgi:hypothetical protein